jgi:hypothetical protein
VSKKDKEIFDEARRLYPEGLGKRGLDVEYRNFLKVCKKQKLDISETVLLLKPAIEQQIIARKNELAMTGFAPRWKYFGTWINNQWWEAGAEIEEVKKASEQDKEAKKRKIQWEDNHQWIEQMDEQRLLKQYEFYPHLRWLIDKLRPEIKDK